MASSLPTEWKELEQHLKQPPNMLLNADVKQIWKDLKKCVLASDGAQVERVFGKLEQEIGKLFQYALNTKKRNYSRLKYSIVATCNVNKEDVSTDKLAPTQKMVGLYRHVIHVPRNVIEVKGDVQAKLSNQGNDGTLLADRLYYLIHWLHGCVSGVSTVQIHPKDDKDTQLSAGDAVTYSEALTLTFEIKEYLLSNKQPRQEGTGRHKEVIDDLQGEIKKLQAGLNRLEEDKARLMTRFRTMAGAKLTHNNPGISDLSDPNRPQKLAEKFSELYDNEWIDGLDILKQNKLDKRKCVDTLSDVLKMCYDESERVADSQMAQLKKDILFLSTHSKPQDVPESVEHGLVEAQSSSVLITTKAVVDIVTTSLLQEKHLKEAVTLLPEYTTRCIEVCWGMVARRPRMVLQWPDISKGRNIDKDMFTLFDGPGATLGFVVWPALLLHKSGPLMSKGVLKAC